MRVVLLLYGKVMETYFLDECQGSTKDEHIKTYARIMMNINKAFVTLRTMSILFYDRRMVKK